MPIYPERLLPKAEFVVLTESQIDNSAFLCRRVLSENHLKNEFGKLSPNAVDGIEFFRLSTNSIPPSERHDVFVKPTIEGAGNYWKPGVPIPQLAEITFEILGDQTSFLFKISDIQLFKDKIPYNKNKEKLKEPMIEFSFVIEHKPLVCNYCHYESKILYGEEGAVKAQKFKEDTYRAAIVHCLQQKFEEVVKF